MPPMPPMPPPGELCRESPPDEQEPSSRTPTRSPRPPRLASPPPAPSGVCGPACSRAEPSPPPDDITARPATARGGWAGGRAAPLGERGGSGRGRRSGESCCCCRRRCLPWLGAPGRGITAPRTPSPPETCLSGIPEKKLSTGTNTCLFLQKENFSNNLQTD